MTESTRIQAVKDLLAEETRRRDKTRWMTIFESADLEPETNSTTFARQMQDVMQIEMDQGFERKIAQMVALRAKTGGRATGRYMESTFHISPAIGRYIFAVFGWHDLSKFPVLKDKLIEFSEAFNFKINPEENQLQFMSEAKREIRLDALDDEDQNEQNRLLTAALFSAIIIPALYFLRRVM